MRFTIIEHSRIESFQKDAVPFLLENEAANSLMLGLCSGFSREDSLETPPLLFSIREHGQFHSP